MSFFFFYKSENRKAEKVLYGGLLPIERRRMWRKGVAR
jgi:hypothetical protein